MRVIYPAPVRTCAKLRCNAEPAASVSLLYADRQVVIGNLIGERDPNLLDLCDEHVARMTPPVGWTVRDERVSAPALTP
jgi:uncharacterized protein DUF3499